MDNNLIEFISLLKASKNKKKMLTTLNDKILTPNEIAEKINMRINHVSYYLSELKKKNLIMCINEEKRKGKLYKLTELGLRVLNEIKKKKYII